MTEKMIAVKSPFVTRMMLSNEYHETLISVSSDVAEWMIDEGIQPIITSAFRPGDIGVHGCGRGLDYRTWHMTKKQVWDLVAYVNKKWVYDSQRPNIKVAIFHDVGRGPHLHLQVHHRTQKRRTETL